MSIPIDNIIVIEQDYDVEEQYGVFCQCSSNKEVETLFDDDFEMDLATADAFADEWQALVEKDFSIKLMIVHR